MTRFPTITGCELIAALARAGFEVVRVKGRHSFLRHPDGRTTVVPEHVGEDIGPGLRGKVLRDCKLTRDELRQHL